MNQGVLTLEHSKVSGNTALDRENTHFFGGGIDTRFGLLTLIDTVVSGNTPDDCVGCPPRVRRGQAG